MKDKDDDPNAPRRNGYLIGHAGAESTLIESWKSGRMHHGWIIVGPPGIGKATLAFRLARFILSRGNAVEEGGLFGAPPPPTSLIVDLELPACKRIAVGTHGDLLTIERTWDEKRQRYKRDVPVDQVRRIPTFLHQSASEGGWRVVVIDGADNMNTNGQNALLKMLEEPPPRALILMVADNAGALLPTLRSRSRLLTLNPLPEDSVVNLLARYASDLANDQRLPLARLAEGSIGRALDLHAGGGLDLFRALLGVLEMVPRLDVLSAYKFIETVLRGNDEVAWFALCDLLRWWLARLAQAVARNIRPPEIVSGEAVLLDRLIDAAHRHGSLDHWVEVWENTRRALARADWASLDRRQVLLSVLMSINTAAEIAAH